MNTDAIKNRVQLIGRIGQDPELKEMNNGRKMMKFSLATNESYKNAQGEFVNDTQWHPIIVWNNLVNLVAEKIFKGDEILVEGKLSHRDYVDKNGEKKRISQVEATNILLLNKRNSPAQHASKEDKNLAPF